MMPWAIGCGTTWSCLCCNIGKDDEMKLNALLLKPQDNVVTCIREVKKGEPVVYRREGEILSVEALEDIPDCHKAAVRDIPAGDLVLKYAQVIGEAREDLLAGSWVSHLNIQSIPRDYESELLP